MLGEHEEMAQQQAALAQSRQALLDQMKAMLGDCRSAFLLTIKSDGTIQSSAVLASLTDLLAMEEWARRAFRDHEERIFGVRLKV